MTTTAPPKRRPKVHPNTLKRVRLAVFTRDAFACRACGWRAVVPEGYDGRYALGGPDDRPGKSRFAVRILELDHVIPYSRGGPFTVENLQALCNSCNARKGARV